MRDHCCGEIRAHIQVLHEGTSFDVVANRPVLYDPVFDEYLLACSYGIADRALIAWCPWCGTGLPESKRELWFAEVDSLGLRPDDPAVPDRLRSDAWWSPHTGPATTHRSGPAGIAVPADTLRSPEP
jgi:hypothetical protein